MKPQNTMVVGKEQLVVADFATSGRAESGNRGVDAYIQHTGIVLTLSPTQQNLLYQTSVIVLRSSNTAILLCQPAQPAC